MKLAVTISSALAILLTSASLLFAADNESAAQVPPVLLTETHRKHCRLKPGDAFPPMKLPRLDGQPGEP